MVLVASIGKSLAPVTIHTWLERFNKQKPRTFEKAVTPVDAENWISHMEKIFDVKVVMNVFNEARFSPVYISFEVTRLAMVEALTSMGPKERLHGFSLCPWAGLSRAGESSNEFSRQRFIPYSWDSWASCLALQKTQPRISYWGGPSQDQPNTVSYVMEFTDVAKRADAARNFEILRDRDDYDRPERSDKRHKSGDQHQSSDQQNSPPRGLTIGMTVMGHDRHWAVPSKTRHSPRVILTLSAPHVDVDTQESVVVLQVLVLSAVKLAIFSEICKRRTRGLVSSGYADQESQTYRPCHCADFRTRLLKHRDLPLQFNDKIRSVNALPLDMCEFDIILGMDWLSAHHATIDCHSRRVIFGNIRTPEFIYHGSLPGKSMKIISALEALYSINFTAVNGFLANIHYVRHQIILQFMITHSMSKPTPRLLIACSELVERVEGSVARLVGARFIRPSVSPWGAPDLFSQEKGGSMRFWYRLPCTEQITIRNRYRPPL
ncbi:putative reverse transcriptase domain-containing protein [Tanacetum coccineum]|uniref:Reverse transcriptase domain-containing protein n=1 Tax=Tanacetum coccineum TaxID=301880 RepID=A0ABQ4YNK1_9ASTR